MEGVEEYMLPCVNKKLFGMECLGCGIQRATALFFKGEFIAAFKLYPAIYTLLLLLSVVIFNLFVKFRYDFKIKMGLIYLNVLVMVVSYIYKLVHLT
jgi:hypothetical protein